MLNIIDIDQLQTQFSQYIEQTINQFPDLIFWSADRRFLYIEDSLFSLFKPLSLDHKLIFVLDKLNFILARRVLTFLFTIVHKDDH